MNPRLGLLLFFEGDHRKVNVTVKGVTTFTAISAVLKQGDQDVTSTYINATVDTLGNIILTDDIGEKASMPAGNYRYYVTGTHGGKISTWYFDILVLAKIGWAEEVPADDYPPLVEEITAYEGDTISKTLTIPGAVFTTAEGVFKLDSSDVTATYCTGSVAVSGDTISTHTKGGQASIPAGEYIYFVTGTYNNSQAKATWLYRISILSKQSIL